MIDWKDPYVRTVLKEYLDEAGRLPTRKEVIREVYGEDERDWADYPDEPEEEEDE